MGYEVMKLPTITFRMQELKPGSEEWISVRDEMYKALEEYGSFEAILDGIPKERLYEKLIKEVFTLPLDTKFENSENVTGYNKKDQFFPLLERLNILHVETPGVIESFFKIIWPDHEDQEFCDLVHSYIKRLSELDEMVKKMIFEKLGIEKYLDELTKSTRYGLGFMKYTVPKAEETKFGQSPHTDLSISTILSQHQVNGLQYMNKNGQWVAVEYSSPDSYIFLVNDCLKITPIVICWEIWKGVCSCKYGNQRRMVHSKIIFQICWILKTALKLSFPSCSTDLPWFNLCEIVEKLRPVPTGIKVMWHLPTEGRVKVNTDGSYFQQEGKAGIGGIVRNHDGGIIMAFSIPTNCGSNNIAEAQAAKFGVQWCVSNGYTDVDLELDSLVISNMLKGATMENCKLKAVIEETTHIISRANFEINHCYREANQVADAMAKLAARTQEQKMVYQCQELPRLARGPYQLDRRQIPSIRMKYDKANFYVS